MEGVKDREREREREMDKKRVEENIEIDRYREAGWQ